MGADGEAAADAETLARNEAETEALSVPEGEASTENEAESVASLDALRTMVPVPGDAVPRIAVPLPSRAVSEADAHPDMDPDPEGDALLDGLGEFEEDDVAEGDAVAQ